MSSGASKGIKFNEKEGEWECNFCKSTEGARCGRWNTYFCTRKLGHKGDHVACGAGEDEHCVYRWPNTTKDK